jgi:hypothetical protein
MCLDGSGPEEGEVDEHYEFTEDDIIIEQPLEEEELEVGWSP